MIVLWHSEAEKVPRFRYKRNGWSNTRVCKNQKRATHEVEQRQIKSRSMSKVSAIRENEYSVQHAQCCRVHAMRISAFLCSNERQTMSRLKIPQKLYAGKNRRTSRRYRPRHYLLMCRNLAERARGNHRWVGKKNHKWLPQLFCCGIQHQPRLCVGHDYEYLRIPRATCPQAGRLFMRIRESQALEHFFFMFSSELRPNSIRHSY